MTVPVQGRRLLARLRNRRCSSSVQPRRIGRRDVHFDALEGDIVRSWWREGQVVRVARWSERVLPFEVGCSRRSFVRQLRLHWSATLKGRAVPHEGQGCYADAKDEEPQRSRRVVALVRLRTAASSGGVCSEARGVLFFPVEATHKEDLCACIAYGVERAVHDLGMECSQFSVLGSTGGGGSGERTATPARGCVSNSQRCTSSTGDMIAGQESLSLSIRSSGESKAGAVGPSSSRGPCLQRASPVSQPCRASFGSSLVAARARSSHRLDLAGELEEAERRRIRK